MYYYSPARVYTRYQFSSKLLPIFIKLVCKHATSLPRELLFIIIPKIFLKSSEKQVNYVLILGDLQDDFKFKRDISADGWIIDRTV